MSGNFLIWLELVGTQQDCDQITLQRNAGRDQRHARGATWGKRWHDNASGVGRAITAAILSLQFANYRVASSPVVGRSQTRLAILDSTAKSCSPCLDSPILQTVQFRIGGIRFRTTRPSKLV